MTPPDFRQLARDLFMREDYGDNPIPEIEAALRAVWNARGAADVQAVNLRCHELLGTASGGIYADHFATTIQALDWKETS